MGNSAGLDHCNEKNGILHSEPRSGFFQIIHDPNNSKHHAQWDKFLHQNLCKLIVDV